MQNITSFFLLSTAFVGTFLKIEKVGPVTIAPNPSIVGQFSVNRC